jgi:hypothetical protein
MSYKPDYARTLHPIQNYYANSNDPKAQIKK